MITTIKKKPKTDLVFSTHFSLCLFHEKSNYKGDKQQSNCIFAFKKKNHTHKKLKSLLTSITTKPLVSNQILQTNSKIHLFKAHSKKVINNKWFFHYALAEGLIQNTTCLIIISSNEGYEVS